MYHELEGVRGLLKGKAIKASIGIQGSEDGRTALWWASRLGSEEMVKLLLNAGGNPMIADNNGITPIQATENFRCARRLEVSQWARGDAM